MCQHPIAFRHRQVAGNWPNFISKFNRSPQYLRNVLYVFARVCARKRMACITRQTADFHFQGQARAGNEEGRYLLCTLLFHSTRVQEIKMALNLRRFLSGVFHFLQENSLFSHQGRWIIRALCI